VPCSHRADRATSQARETLPASRFGQLPGERIVYTPVEPTLVVEFEHDNAYGRFRHAKTYLRVRTELRPSDLSV
jgi:hypothetical protein